MADVLPAAVDAVDDFGLPAATLAKLRRAFDAHPLLRRVIVYGSRAKGCARPGSDIDLALDAPGLPFAEFLRIEQELDDLSLPYEIDLALLGQIESADLLEHIGRVGRPLWSAP
jgi:predicted nucleotidyltransferase